MSVDKVNRYKEEKTKRSEALKKEKRESLIARIVVIVLCVALAFWIGFSIYQKIEGKSAGTNATTVNVQPLDDYVDGMESVEADPGE